VDCRPRQRCRQYLTCPDCARIRQARIADRAEAIFAGATATYLTRLTPDPLKGQSVPQIRRRFLRHNRPWRFLWTVESGDLAGKTHFNIITTVPDPWLPKGVSAHHSKIRTSPRIVAAYISKRQQRPHPDDYAGPAYGAAGPPSAFLLRQRTSRAVAALTAAHLLAATNTVDLAARTDTSARETARAALRRCRAILAAIHPPQRTALFTPLPAPPPRVPELTATLPTHGRARQ